ncbi:hypothetical protein CpipJ_CPIJ017730 [Culex quinquefasciatus]|uniref:Uncharacterized protein n=1 Tax=Culex quinquefasciatus TaxID=7176 RepID=B0XE19_CULQU|nr:hypothetical protein CpipJ_CPIJ017730 [Culex quinquefasciatus]|eukprot:XP_001867891.1 hypothetical protein CpipJ_CPIJ017730 [Culex quinquefasciatus]
MQGYEDIKAALDRSTGVGIFTVGVPAAITCFTTEVISESSPLAISASPSAASRGSATAMASNAVKTITNFIVLDFGIELNRALFLSSLIEPVLTCWF